MNSPRWTGTLLRPEATLEQAIHSLNQTGLKIVLVTDEERELLGVLTDSDIRRLVLDKISLEEGISSVMIREPVVARDHMNNQDILWLMTETGCYQIPVLDTFNRVVSLATIAEILHPKPIENPVVLMAGGLGSRLGSITKIIPKPLVPVGGKPVIETLLDSLLSKGFKNIYISVNYMADTVVKALAHHPLATSIKYLREDKKLGTAGSLSLLDRSSADVLVMNADILTKIDYREMLKFHQREGADITVAVRREKIAIPYGVMNLEGNQIISLQEKPDHYYFANVGIYVISPQALAEIPINTPFDMTTLIEHRLKQGQRVLSFPVHEYWIDIGRPEELERARMEFKDVDINS